VTRSFGMSDQRKNFTLDSGVMARIAKGALWCSNNPEKKISSVGGLGILVATVETNEPRGAPVKSAGGAQPSTIEEDAKAT